MTTSTSPGSRSASTAGSLLLVVGTPKSGSTSLAAHLAAHPQVRSPRRFKELRYFDLFHDRGPDWYLGSFDAAADGEYLLDASPQYVYSDAARERIERSGFAAECLCIVRDPVERSWSDYLHFQRHRMPGAGFAEVAASYPQVIDGSRYSEVLPPWSGLLPPERIIVFEEFRLGPQRVLSSVFASLGLEASDGAPDERATNPAFVPRYPMLYSRLSRLKTSARRLGLGPVISAAQRLGISDVFRTSRPVAPMPDELRVELRELFADEAEFVSDYRGAAVSGWD